MRLTGLDIDLSTAHWFERANGSREPDSDLILDVIHRAFKDARGETNGIDSQTAKINAIKSGRDFILDSYKIDWGALTVTASELCVIATGSDHFVKKLQYAILSNNMNVLGRYKKRILPKKE